jgi:hypothetical protein
VNNRYEKVTPHPGWSPQEKWVWEKVCAGGIADFNKLDGSELDPGNPEGWPDERIITLKFLETILLYEPYRGAIPRQGVQVYGAWFKDKIDLSNASLAHQLVLDKSRFESDVDLSLLRSPFSISLFGSTFEGKLDMNGLEIDQHLFMRDGARFKDVDLIGARVGGQADMSSSTFEGKLNMESIQVNGHIFMRSSEFKQAVVMLFVSIHGSLDISSSTFISIDLTGAYIKGELHLGYREHDKTKWKADSKLTLRNTQVGAVQDRRDERKDAWPDELILDGFTYTRLGGYAAGSEHSMADREVAWLKYWLLKQKHYSPQPYEQMAWALREAGHKDKANDVLFIGKERERSEAKGIRKLKLTLLYRFVGYGYRSIRYSSVWVFIFTSIGALLLQAGGQGPSNGMPYGVSYSLDMLLPIIKLNEWHYKIELFGFTKYYFYFQKLMGYFLASMLIAGLSGITKK